MADKIVFDLETQKDFAEVGGRNKPHLLKVSVLGAYSYAKNKFFVFEESRLHKFGEMLEVADQVIGFNIKHFDYRVLQPYLNFEVTQLPTLDILEEIEKSLGHRVGLDVVAQATLGAGKSGSGLQAINLWRLGRLDELKKYCLRDVEITKQIYDYGQSNGKLLYNDFFEIRELPVSFPEPEVRQNVSRQTSLF